MRFFIANAVARVPAGVTLASAALAGPVLKNRKKTARKTNTHAAGNGVRNMRIVAGNANRIAIPETRKYALGKRRRTRSPAQPPSSVASRPAVAVIAPKGRLIVPKLAAPHYPARNLAT